MNNMLPPKYRTIAHYASIILMCATAVVLIGLQSKPFGWYMLAANFILLLACEKRFARHIGLILFSLGILGIAPIETDISVGAASTMAAGLLTALLVPYFIVRFLYKDRSVRFTFHHGRGWYRNEKLYILLTAVIAYLLLPFYLTSTGAYLHWPDADSMEDIVKLFIGTNALGIWDELFFICVVLSLLRRHLPFWQANIAQAVLFTSFLHELGFTSWAFIPIYLFALLQGFIFKKTESLLYVIAIHLTLDFILFLALINAHNPSVFPIFIT